MLELLVAEAELAVWVIVGVFRHATSLAAGRSALYRKKFSS